MSASPAPRRSTGSEVAVPTLAVTGASGRLGRLVVHELLALGVPAPAIVAVVRSPAKVADLAEHGVQVREGDYARPDTLRAALDGVERLLLISSSESGRRLAHHANVLSAAEADGVSRVVYTSMLNADDTTNPLAGEHQDTEQVLRRAQASRAVLRNGWYVENYTDQLGAYLARGEIVGAAAAGRVSAVSRGDLAAAAAAALLQDEAGDRTYELGGPAFDLPELARVITEVTGTPVTYRDLPVDDYAAHLRRAGLGEFAAAFVASLDASIAQGDLATAGADLAQLLGRPPASLVDAVRAASR